MKYVIQLFYDWHIPVIQNLSVGGSDDWQTTDKYTGAWAPHAPTLRPNAPTLSSALYNSDYLKQERKQRAVSILGDGSAASETREIAEALNYDRQEKAAFVQERLLTGERTVSTYFVDQP